MSIVVTIPSLASTLAASTGRAIVWPVWGGSTTRPVEFTPLPKKRAARLWQKARAYDRATSRPGSGQHGGALGRVALDVLQVLLFDFLNYATGQLDPSHAAIAYKAGCCVTAVKNALAKLKARGFLIWQRRARHAEDERGGFLLRQETNAYAICPETCWQGWREPPPPEPWQWGACPPLPPALTRAAEAFQAGERRCGLAALDEDPQDSLAAALARLARSMMARNPSI